MQDSIHSKIKARIEQMPGGFVFSLSDFFDLADLKTVSTSLSRLVGEDFIEKIRRGLFCRKCDREGIHPNDLAMALARGNRWQVVPSGETAMHLVGLSGQAPPVWTYITDGTGRSYAFEHCVIRFKHASGKFLTGMSEKTALLVQTLKACGKAPLDAEITKKILAFFGKCEFSRLVSESKQTTAWISARIFSLFGKESGKSPED